ncbi:MAG: hypothetical protein AAF570_12440, partial [Bacteroidota bacterium]
AWQEYQDEQNSNWDPSEEPVEPHNQGSNNNAPPYPEHIRYIPTMDEIMSMHEISIWQERFVIPSVLTYAHRFESYEMIAELAYEDPDYDDALKAYNPDVITLSEGESITLPTVEDLGPPYVEVLPQSIGSSGFEIWVAPDASENPEMWYGAPDRLVLELADEAVEGETTETAANELWDAASFTPDTTQVEAENAVTIATNLIDFILASGFGQESTDAGTPWQDAGPGDAITIKPDEVSQAAEAIYGHAGRAAWIMAFNPGAGGPATASKNSDKTEFSPTSGLINLQLPSWAEMAGLDPLPAHLRGVAPRSSITVIAGDTWSALAQAAYGDWEKALKLAEYSDNENVTLDAGNVVTLPSLSDLNTIVAVAADSQVMHSAVTDGPVGGNNDGTTTTTAHVAADLEVGKDGEEPEVDIRDFVPGNTIPAVPGDTWSEIATKTYDDFSLFVRLSNHPKNVSYKALPAGAPIYLPPLDELMEVPEFGYGLSPNGYPLLTEMLRIPTMEELHHVWVENQAKAGEEVKGVWMMASQIFELEPKSLEWAQGAQEGSEVHTAATFINNLAQQGAESKDQVVETKEPVQKVVDAGVLGEGESASDVVRILNVPSNHNPPNGFNMRIVGCQDDTYFLGDGTLLREIGAGDIDNHILFEIVKRYVNGNEENSAYSVGMMTFQQWETYTCPEEISTPDVSGAAISGKIDLTPGTFEVPTAEGEIYIEQAGPEGRRIDVTVGGYANGTMDIIRNENGFQSVGGHNTFLNINSPEFCDMFGDNVRVGINARIEDDAVIGESVFEIDGE